MHFPIACSQSLAEAARVSEATAGAESLMDGVQGGVTYFSCCWPHHKPVTPPHPTATLGFTRRLFLNFIFCHFLPSQRLESWEGRNSGGIRYCGARAWSVFLGQPVVMKCHHIHFLKQMRFMNDDVYINVKDISKTRRWHRHEHLIILTGMMPSALKGAAVPGWLPWWQLVWRRGWFWSHFCERQQRRICYFCG